MLSLLVFPISAVGESGVDEKLLDDLMAAPYADDLVAASRAGTIAWKELERGTRSIWIAGAPDFEPQQLVAYPGDDGQQLRSLTLSPAADYVYYSRGGAPNSDGLHPNPENLARKTEQAIWQLPVDGGPPRRISEGSGLQVNPATGDLVFSRDGELRIISAARLDAGDFESEVYFHARGGLRQLSWSSDGQSLLFASDRGDHAFIGIYRPTEDRITWLDPDVSRDMYPAWSPDDSRVAFLRVPGRRKTDYNDFSQGWSFAVRIYDVANDYGRELWRSPRDGGSLYEWWRATPLLWLDDETLVFNSEHDNWLRSYRLDVASGSVEPLFEEDCEIFANTGNGRRPYIASTNCGDIDRRHLVEFRLDPADPKALTSGEGIEIAPVLLPGGSHVAYLRSTPHLPQAIYVTSLENGAMQRVSRMPPTRFTTRNMVAPRSVTFPSAAEDGETIYGQLFASDDETAAKTGKPALIFLHGGPIRQMVAGWYSVDYYDRLYAFGQYLANSGYVVLAVNYRAGVGYGKAYRTIDGLGPHGALELQDVVGGARFLQSLDDVDPERIGLYGGSYGGYLTAMGLAHHSDLFKAGFDLHGVHDWAWRGEYFTWTKGGGWATVGDEAMATAYEASPVAALASWHSPVFFAHGDDDHNVAFRQTVHLANELRLRNVPVDVLVLPGEGHGIMRHDSWRSIFVRAAEFFDRYLGGARP